jgi:hypothetical protein
MPERRLRVMEETQGDPAGQELAVGEGGAVLGAVVLGDAIGELRLAAVEGAPGRVVALDPEPFDEGRVQRPAIEQLGGPRILLLAPAPTRPLVDEAGIGLQDRGHLLHEGIEIAAHVAERKPRFGERPRALIHAHEHPANGRIVALPEQPVHALDVVGRMQMGREG